jgi:hypothetical protein
MKSSNIILIIGIFCQTVEAEYIVPAYIDENNDWSVDISVSSPPNQTVRMKLRMARFDIIPIPLRAHETNRVLFTIPGNANSSDPPFSYESTPGRNSENVNSAQLGVQPGSQLLTAAGSIAMIQLSQEGRAREGHLVIGSNFSSFNATCFPGSLMRLEIPSIRSEVTISVGGFVDTSYAIDIRFVCDRVLADVPHRIVEWIIGTLRGTGARRRYGSPERFSNCTRELVVASLPSLEFRRRDLGKIVLYPDEYMEFGTDGHCFLLLRPAFVEDDFIRVNLLKLPNINVRVSNTGIVEFCDAMVDPDYAGRHLALMTNMSRVTEEPVEHSSPPTAPPTQSRMQRFAGHLRRFLACLRIF